MNAGWGDFEVALHVLLSRWPAEDAAVSVDEGEILALLFGKRGAVEDTCQTI